MKRKVLEIGSPSERSLMAQLRRAWALEKCLNDELREIEARRHTVKASLKEVRDRIDQTFARLYGGSSAIGHPGRRGPGTEQACASRRSTAKV